MLSVQCLKMADRTKVRLRLSLEYQCVVAAVLPSEQHCGRCDEPQVQHWDLAVGHDDAADASGIARPRTWGEVDHTSADAGGGDAAAAVASADAVQHGAPAWAGLASSEDLDDSCTEVAAEAIARNR